MSSKNLIFSFGFSMIFALSPDGVPIIMIVWPALSPSLDISASSLSCPPFTMIFWRSGSTPVREKSWYLKVSPLEEVSTSTSCFLPWCLTITT
jgi:hypothetical protein